MDKYQSAISENCNHILNTVDLVDCLKMHPQLFVKLRKSIESIDVISKRDMTTLMNIWDQTLVAYPPSSPLVHSPVVVPSNLFHCFQDILFRDNMADLISYIAYALKGANMFILIDGISSWTFVKRWVPPRNGDYGTTISRLENIVSDLGWERIPLEYVDRITCEDSSWFFGLKSSERFKKLFTTLNGNYTKYNSENMTAQTLLSSPGEDSFLLKAENTGKKNGDGPGIKVNVTKGTFTEHHAFEIRATIVNDKVKSSGTDVHFHGELKLSDSNIHLCLYWVKYKMYVPLSWYGKPELDIKDGCWRWGGMEFCNKDKNVFVDHKVQYKESWAMEKTGEVQLVAFVKQK